MASLFKTEIEPVLVDEDEEIDGDDTDIEEGEDEEEEEEEGDDKLGGSEGVGDEE